MMGREVTLSPEGLTVILPRMPAGWEERAKRCVAERAESLRLSFRVECGAGVVREGARPHLKLARP